MKLDSKLFDGFYNKYLNVKDSKLDDLPLHIRSTYDKLLSWQESVIENKEWILLSSMLTEEERKYSSCDWLNLNYKVKYYKEIEYIIYYAVEYDNKRLLRFVEDLEDKNVRSFIKRTIFEAAVYYNNVNLAAKYNKFINYRNNEFLIKNAILRGHISIIEYMIELYRMQIGNGGFKDIDFRCENLDEKYANNKSESDESESDESESDESNHHYYSDSDYVCKSKNTGNSDEEKEREREKDKEEYDNLIINLLLLASTTCYSNIVKFFINCVDDIEDDDDDDDDELLKKSKCIKYNIFINFNDKFLELLPFWADNQLWHTRDIILYNVAINGSIDKFDMITSYACKNKCNIAFLDFRYLFQCDVSYNTYIGDDIEDNEIDDKELYKQDEIYGGMCLFRDKLDVPLLLKKICILIKKNLIDKFEIDSLITSIAHYYKIDVELFTTYVNHESFKMEDFIQHVKSYTSINIELDVFDILIGMNVDITNTILSCLFRGNVELIKYVAEKYSDRFDSDTLFVTACKSGNLQSVKYLYEKFKPNKFIIRDVYVSILFIADIGDMEYSVDVVRWLNSLLN
jgi:hypothetical protein